MIRKSLLAALLLVAIGVRAEIVEFETFIDGEQALECAGTGSPATGEGTFTLDTETGDVTYDLQFDEGALLGTERFAHVHGPGAPCVGAKIVYDLPNGARKLGTARMDAAAVQDMLDELHYVNIHTTEVGVGEIRGQIVRKREPTFSDVPATSTKGITLLIASLAGIALILLKRQ